MQSLFLHKKSPLYELFQAHAREIKTVTVFSFVINLLVLVPSIYMLQIYDRVLTSFNVWTLLMLTLIVVFLYVISSLLDRSRSYITLYMAEKINSNLTQRIYEILHQPQDQKTNLTQALNDLGVIRNFISGTPMIIFFDVPWIPIFLIVIFIFNVWMGVFALSAATILFFLTFLSDRLTSKEIHTINDAMTRANMVAQDSSRHAEVIKVLGMRVTMKNIWLPAHEDYLSRLAVMSQKILGISNLTKCLRIIFQSLSLGLGAWLVIDNQINPGMMIAGNILLSRFLGPIDSINTVWKQWSQFREADHRITDILKLEEKLHEKTLLPPPKGLLQVELLSLIYPDQKEPVLDQLNFKLEAGSVLVILGPNGSGKSSLLKCMVGVTKCSSGKIKWDGSHVDHWNSDHLGQYIGYLPQDVQLLRGSIAENIGRFKKRVSEDIVKASQDSFSHQMITSLFHGYDTLLGDAGHGISLGQKQKIGLARALFGNPTIFILDEPNSFLDETGRQELVQTLTKLKSEGKTIIMTTHHRDLIDLADNILVLVKGKIQLYGPRNQVLTQLVRKPAK